MLTALLCALLAAPAPAELHLPAGAPITLDGRIDEAEWSDAFVIEEPLKETGGGDARVRAKRTGPWLALAVGSSGRYRGEVLRLYVADGHGAWITNLVLGLGQPALPPALWRRIAPASLADADLGPGDCPRACLARVDVAGEERWSAELLVRIGALGIGRGDRRDLRVLLLLDAYDPERARVLEFPFGAPDPADVSRYARLLSPDGWGAKETWPPVTPEESRVFDDNELLYRLFLEHDKISVGDAPEQLVIANAVRPRSMSRVNALRRELEAGRSRNPTLPAWTYFLGRLLHEANLYAEARAVIDSIPAPLRRFDAFAGLMAEHALDTGNFALAEEICLAHPWIRGQSDVLKLARRGKEAQEKEKALIEGDAKKLERNPQVRFKTAKGDFVLELFEDEAPAAVRNFVDLVLRRHYYDGLRFHEVEGGRLAMIGDPRTRLGSSTAEGGPPWRLREEKTGRSLLRGYAAALPVGGGVFHGSQFFIALAPMLGEMERTFVFGRVVEGEETLLALEQDDEVTEVEVVFRRNHGYDPLASRLDR